MKDSSTDSRGRFVEIDGFKVHYEIYGNGPSILLLIHGAVGSCNDFALQMGLGDDAGLAEDKFTVVAFDLPGYGRSSIPEGDVRAEPTMDYFQLAASTGASLMRLLGYKTYSVGGWNDGARVACLMAIKNRSRVNALLLWGFVPIMDKQSCWAIARTRDTSIWDRAVLEFYSSVYGEQTFSEMWREYVDFVIKTLELPDQFDIRKELSQIKCPTLVLYGTKDPIVSFEEHVKPIETQIYDSDIKQFKGLAHNIHQADSAQFNEVLTNFIIGANA